MGDGFLVGDGIHRRRDHGRQDVDVDCLVDKYAINKHQPSSSASKYSIFALVWAVTLVVLRLLSRVHSTWASWWTVVKLEWRRRRRRKGSSLSGLLRFSADEKAGKCRVPEHLALVVQDLTLEGQENEGFWLSRVAELVVWCVVVGVPAVTVYDTAGVLKKAKEKLAERLVAVQKAVLGEEFSRFRVKSNCVRIDYGYTNGRKVEHWTDFSIVGPNDCKPAIVAAVRRLAEKVKADQSRFDFDSDARRGLSKYPGRSKLTAVSAEEFGDELSKGDEGSQGADASLSTFRVEPDLMINVGRVQTTAGFMPWHIGFTTIFLVPSLSALTEDSFLDLLEQFSGCEQRFGK